MIIRQIISLVLTFSSLIIFSRVALTKEKEGFKPIFSIKLTGGWNYIRFGDINKSLGSFNCNDVFEETRNIAPELISGEIKKLKNFFHDWETELIISLNPNIAISLATSGSLQRRNESSLTYIYRGFAGDQISEYTFIPEVRVSMPVKLGIYYTFSNGTKTNFFLKGGIAYNSATTSEIRRYELTPPIGASEWVVRQWKTNHKLFSEFYLGIGVEYYFKKNIAFVVEARGVYAKIKGLEGTMQSEHIFAGIYGEREGTLYFFNMWDGVIGTRYNDLEIWDNPPEGSFRDLENVRKAVLDLSGFSLRVGIKVSLF